LHTKQGKSSKDKEAVTLRQRIKNCFAWNYKGTHKANPQREIYCICKAPSKATTKQKHKGNLLHTKQAKRQRFKKLFRLELAKPHTKQTHKGNLLHLQTRQNGKGLKSCFAWNYKATTKQTHKGKSIVHQTGKTAKDKEAVTLFCF